ncbi:hypothetical protein [Photobacterium leiognathi]|uniref:hypothetical protein n=1 Tax=Photobacterium leiognathi TaxID=553611 RepID=UPI002738DDC8|nr:hypothetical protein [Photobacterium leiognathi]
MKKIGKAWQFITHDLTFFKILVILAYLAFGLSAFIKVGALKPEMAGGVPESINMWLLIMSVSFIALMIASKRLTIALWLVICVCLTAYTQKQVETITANYTPLIHTQAKDNSSTLADK